MSRVYYSKVEAQAAVKVLGIGSYTEYKKRYKEDPMLPSVPPQVYASEGWVDFNEFLGTHKVELYQNYEDAKAAAVGLNINSIKDYNARRSLDPRLPATPEVKYKGVGWVDWYSFLDKANPCLYETYEEAKAAARALGINGWTDYKMSHKKDPRLPSSPDVTYKNKGWTNWHEFRGRKKPSFYRTYSEAQAAAIKLGVVSCLEYQKRFKEDPSLHGRPDLFYRDEWINWYIFLGRKKMPLYKDINDAKAAVRRLGIKTQTEYILRFREDERLPSNPSVSFKESGWEGFPDFLGTEGLFPVEKEYPNIWSECERWLIECRGIAAKRGAIRAFLTGYCYPRGIPDDALYVLTQSNDFDGEGYAQFIMSQADSARLIFNSSIIIFHSWLLDEYCMDVEVGDRVLLPGYKNPFIYALNGLADSLETFRPSQTTKAPLSYEYILRARQFLVPDSDLVMQNRPAFADLTQLQRLFSSRCDWLDVEESILDKNDPDCIWRAVGKRDSGVGYQVWSPVRFVALYTLIRYPLRGQQIVWLDSGEGDVEIAVLSDMGEGLKWEKNTNRVAMVDRKRRPQAAVQKGEGGLPKLFVNTNKTGRVEGGYEVEWVPDDLAYWLLKLRDWQIKYNPIAQSTRWTSFGLQRLVNEKILRARGSQCFLFRVDGSGVPITTSSAFSLTLPALLYEIQRNDENLVHYYPHLLQRSRFQSPYTPHSLRVSLITAFVIDGAAPIAVISKLVGHASLVMTIYYISLGGDKLRSIMAESEKRTELSATKVKVQGMQSHGIGYLREELIITDGNRSLFEDVLPSSACVVFDYGVCPMAGNGCSEGGPVVYERRPFSSSVHGEVPGGYLGRKNCPRCRFFVTGVAFLGGLVALANEISLECFAESARYQEFTSNVERLERCYYDTVRSGGVDEQQTERKQASANQQLSAAKLDSLLADYSAVSQYVNGCIALVNEHKEKAASSQDIRLIVSGDLHDLSLEVGESSLYHLLAEICQNATIYKSADPSRALPLLSQAIDRMADNNGLYPAMFRLDEDQKLIVANELMQLLLARLGSWERIDDLFSGELSLLDLDAHGSDLVPISTEVQEFFGKARSRRNSLTVKDNE